MERFFCRWVVVCCCLIVVGVGGEAVAAEGSFGASVAPVQRGGFHFQAVFGFGAGSDAMGLWHTMEVGHTFESNGLTLGYTHVFLMNAPAQHPGEKVDMFGGHFLSLKVPLWTPIVVGKIAIGLGESVELSNGFIPYFGFGWHYGVDFHIPLLVRSGITIGLNAVHSITAQHGHLFGAGIALGYTWF